MTRLGVATLLALAVVVHPAEAQLVTNGGFETGALSGWSLTGTNCFTGVTNVSPFEGTYTLRSGPISGTCAVAQSFATTAGAQYTFSFWVANLFAGTPNSFDARWDGVSVYSRVDAAAFDYAQQVFTVAASGPTTTIEFVMRHEPSYYRVDDVRVATVATVPEPSTYALMAAGLLGIVAVRHRRRRARAPID